MRIENDPFRLLLKIVRRKYPKLKARIFFVDKVPGYVTDKDVHGVTAFDVTGKRLPVVLIETSNTFEEAVNTLAHELAHVITGPTGRDHGKKWQMVYEWISKEFAKEMKE